MMDYSDSNSIEEFSVSPSNKSLRSNYSPSKSQSIYNEFYEKKKKRKKLSKHRIMSNTEKYLPPNLRSPCSKNTENHAPKIKPYSIALKSPNTMNTMNINDNNKMSKIVIHSTAKINNLNVIAPEPDTARSTYQDIKALAIEQSYNLHTSSEREIALKRIIGAVPIRPNKLVLHPIGTLPVYQTDEFSYEQRTSCMVITGGAVISAMVIFVAILAFMGYSG